MAQAKTAPAPAPEAAAASPQAAAGADIQQAVVQELKVTGHMMSLPAGLFCFINEANPERPNISGMPGVRVSPPPAGGNNVEIAGFRPDGWLNATGDATLVRVRRGPAQVLVTIYQLPNMPEAAPRLQVRQLLNAEETPVNTPEAPTPPVKTEPQRVDMLAHIQTRGDVGAKFGDWLGETGSNNWIEGFAISAPDDIDGTELSYQAVLGRGWLSPWVEAGQYCGSRGMALPLLGLRVRLTGGAAEKYDITCAASFVGGTSAGPVGNDETCEGDTLAPLEAIRVTLTPRAARKPPKAKR